MTDCRRQKLFLLILFLASLLLMTTACQLFASDYAFKGTHLDPPQPLPDLALMTTGGQPFHLSGSEEELTLVYFGYTFCPDVCPLTMADVRRALDGLEGRERVRVLFVSVDPERDTPDVLGRYLAAFDPTFIGLTGEQAKIDAAKAAFGVFSEKEEVDSAAGYLVSHTSRLFLVNSNGELALLYSFGFAPEDLRSDLEHLLKEG